MGVGFEELKRVCQKPVADGNDVAGLLFGDKASLPITKLLVDRGLSPSIATVGMLVTGVLGSLMQFGSPVVVVGGSLLLLLYYVLDCVDGEVARWRRIEHARWGYYEYIFHFVVKPVCFLCIGFAVWRQLGHTVLLVAAVSAAVSTLWLKLFLGLPSIVFVGSVLGRGFSGQRPYSEYVPGARERLEQRSAKPGEQPAEVFRLRFDLVTLRSLGTNFDVGLLLLVLASLGDLVLGELPWSITLRGLWVLYYGLVLPLDFIDYVRTFVRKGHFDQQMVRLLARAHGFRLPEPGADDTEEPAQGRPEAARSEESSEVASRSG